MATNPNQLSIQPIPGEEGELHLNPSLDQAYENGSINLAEARWLSGETVVNRVFEFSPEAMAEAPIKPNVEAVNPDHKPLPGARREAKLRRPRAPRTPREKMVADQPPESQRVTPHGHDHIPTVINGGKADRR